VRADLSDGAIVFGDLLDPQSEVSRLTGSPRGYRVLEHLGRGRA